MRRLIALTEIVIAVLAVVGAVACWHSGVRTVQFAAIPDEMPAFASTSYSGSWIAAVFFLVAVAAVLVIDAVRRFLSPDPLADHD